jgi:hypothetical protein
VSEKRSVTRALLLLLLARSSRLVTSRAPRFTELSLGAELIFLLHRKTERLTESLTNASQLANSGCSRIVGCCNRLGRTTWAWPTLSRVSPMRRLYKLLPGYHRTYPETDLGFLPPLAACAASVVYSIPSVGVHQRTGEQVFGTTRLCDPIRERANQIFGKRSARLLKLFITGRLPSKSGGAAYRRLHHRLLRPVYSNVVINNVTATTTSANERYVRSTAIRMFIMFCEYIFSCYLFPFILLFSTSSMFELHVVVASIVM